MAIDEPQEQNAANAPGIPTEMSSMVSLLSSSLAGTQGSLGKAYGVMAKSLQQSLEMTQSMSNMLDLLLVDNLSISTRVERRSISERPLIIVVTENKSRFPLPGLTGTLWIGRDDNEAKMFEAVQDSRAFLVSGTTTTTLRNQKEIKNEAPTLYANTSQPPESHIEPVTLMPGTKWVHVLELDLEVLDEWLIEIDITFKSPGTGKPLNKKHECCIYLLDQVQDVIVHGRVDTITEDGSEATCSLWCDPPSPEDDSLDENALTIELLQIVAGRLAAELRIFDDLLGDYAP
ncbi:hypothetical protein BGZ82_008709 [Podila clonocystis]|nr:hypothetical protein BGZ82_008709 [Podila clonocystis]